MRLSHAETQALISARLDGPLDPVAERELNAHLATCDSCRAFNASTVRLASGLQSLPYLPASPAVTRAVLDHVRAPRSPMSWLSGAFPANALPAASAIAAAVIVVFVGSFAAFQFLDDSDDRSTIPASTTIVNDLAQGGNGTSEPDNSVEPTTESVEAQIFATEIPETTTEASEPTAMPGETTATEAGVGAEPTDPSANEPVTEIGPQGGTSQRLPSTEPTDAVPTEPAAATDAPAEPTAQPTQEPTTEDQPDSAERIRSLLGLETAEVTEETPPASDSTVPPTLEPTTQPTPQPTIAPTIEPTAVPTEAPTVTPTEQPTEEPITEPTNEADSDLQIVGPADDAITRPTDESIAEPTEKPTPEPTDAPTEQPTLEPTEEPAPELTDASTVEPTAPPIELREETPGADPTADDGEIDGRAGQGDDDAIDEPIDEIGPSGGSVDDDEGDGDATPGLAGPGQDIESDDGGDEEPIIEPADGDPGDGNDAPGGGDQDENGSGDGQDDPTVEGESNALANADVYMDVQDVPGEGQDARLGIDAEGGLIFSPNPGRVSLDQNGVTLQTGQGPAGQIVEACRDSCLDVSSASGQGGNHTDTPIGWLDGQVIYERLNGDDYAVEFRVIALDDDLQPIEDRLIGGGGQEYETNIRPYAVEGTLLAPSAGGWVRISTAQVEILGNSQFGNDITQIRLYESAGQIAYVSGGTLILAPTSSPGSPILQLPYAGSDYDFSPDGSRIAVVTGTGIEIIDTSGSVISTFGNDGGIAIGSLSWLNDGLVFVDLDGGVLRILQP